MQVNVHDAKSNLSKLLERAERGEEIIIARHGTPVAKLVALPGEPKKRILGAAAGKIRFKEGWNAPLSDEELDEFIGS